MALHLALRAEAAMKVIPVLLSSLLCGPAAAAAAEAIDPSGSYTDAGELAVMLAGSRAVAYYWGDHLTEADRSCSCAYEFAKATDGRWRSTEGRAVLKFDGGGVRIEDPEFGCCGSGIGPPHAEFSHGEPPEACQVVGGKISQLQVGTTVFGVPVPEWASFDDSSAEEPKHAVRARVGAADALLLVPDSELRCERAWAAPTIPIAQAHSNARFFFRAGRPRDAAKALSAAFGAKPWTIRKGNVQAFNDWGFFLEQAKQYPEAVEVLNAVVAAFPDRTVAYLNLADAYVGLGDGPRAKAAYVRYVQRMEKAGSKGRIPDRVRKLFQPRSAEARAGDAERDDAVFVVIPESFQSEEAARSYVRSLRARSGLDLETTFATLGYEVRSARDFDAVRAFEDRVRTEEKNELARWIWPRLCVANEREAQTAAKKLGLAEAHFDEFEGCHRVLWTRSIPRDQVRDIVRKVAGAGHEKQLSFEIAGVVIVLGKALNPLERLQVEDVARKHGAPVQTLRTGLHELDI